MLRMICGIFFLVVMSSLFAAGQGEEDSTLIVGAPMAVFADKWLSYLQEAIRVYDEEHEDVKFVLTDAGYDPKRQLDQVENFIAQDVDSILLLPTTLEIIPLIGNKAKNAGIPIVVVNLLAADDGMKDITSYVGSPEYEAGQMQAQELLKLMGDEGEIAILMGKLGQTGQIERTRGVEETLAPYPGIKIVAEQTGSWDRAQGRSVTQDWLQAYPNLKAIISNNDEMAIGALLAARSSGYSDEDLIIMGVDATPDAVAFLGEGLDVTVFQNAKMQGSRSAEAAHKLAKGEAVPSKVWIPFELVTPDLKEDYS